MRTDRDETQPDGYVGFAGDHRDWPSLADWLRLVCDTPPVAAARER